MVSANKLVGPVVPVDSAVRAFGGALAHALGTRPGVKLAIVALLLLVPAGAPAQSAPSSGGKEAEFKRLAAQIAPERSLATEQGAGSQQEALSILDQFALEALQGEGEPDLKALNHRLAELVAQQPARGESYIVVRLGGSPALFALAANFGVSGPSAVRLYARGSHGYELSARIDRFSQQDFFDDYLELVPVNNAPVFVTVTGRTDELATGMFAAWRFAGGRLENLWSSDLLPQSSYEARPDGLEITYCAETDEDQPSVCRGMARDRYVWDGVAWKPTGQTRLQPLHTDAYDDRAARLA